MTMMNSRQAASPEGKEYGHCITGEEINPKRLEPSPSARLHRGLEKLAKGNSGMP